jgi:SAM-dependent methyltransferase
MGKEEWTNRRLVELSGGYWKACALHAGVKLRAFSVLGDAAVSGPEASRAMGASERGGAMLLNALAAMGLLVKEENRFANTPESRRLLCEDSEAYTGHILMHHHHLMEGWSRLAEAVVSGTPVRQRSSHSDDQSRESFLMGMFNLASELAPRVVPLVDLSGRKRLLDLGGGPGTYAIHFCLQNPRLSASVFDLPSTRPFAEKTIERFGLKDRVSFLSGDYLEDEVPGAFDSAWLSHILHAEGPEDCRRIIRKALRALEPGGIILIQEFILDDSMDGPLHPALFALNMLVGTEAGRAYSEGQIRAMLETEGVRDVRRLAFESPTGSGIIMGTI